MLNVEQQNTTSIKRRGKYKFCFPYLRHGIYKAYYIILSDTLKEQEYEIRNVLLTLFDRGFEAYLYYDFDPLL